MRMEWLVVTLQLVNDEDDALKIRMQYIIVNEDRQRGIVIDLSEILIRYSLMSETTTISETKSINTKKKRRNQTSLLFCSFSGAENWFSLMKSVFSFFSSKKTKSDLHFYSKTIKRRGLLLAHRSGRWIWKNSFEAKPRSTYSNIWFLGDNEYLWER